MTARIARRVTDRLTEAEAKRPLPANRKADYYAIMGRTAWSGERDRKVTLKAMALFEKGLELNSNSVPALQGFARTKISAVLENYAPANLRSAWLDQAEKAIDHVIAQRRRSYGAYRLRRSLFRARREWERAAEDLKQALQINSEYTEALGELGRVQIELGSTAEAVANIEKAISLNPTVSSSLAVWCLWAGQAALHVGDYSMAVSRFLQAEQANRANEHLPPWLALAYAGSGQWDKARSLMSGYLRNMPTFSIARWQEENGTRNALVASQRGKLVAILRKLAVPEEPTARAKPARAD